MINEAHGGRSGPLEAFIRDAWDLVPRTPRGSLGLRASPTPHLLTPIDMRIAILSDIHANIHALRAVAVDVQDQRIDETWSAGDVVGYGGNPREALDWIQKGAQLFVKGNHDEAVAAGELTWFNPMAAQAARAHAQLLTPPERSQIYAWPLRVEREIDGAKILLVHASPDDPLHEYVQPQDARLGLARWEGGVDIVILGHTHRPFFAILRDASGSDWTGVHFEENILEQRPRARGLVIINPGSVGQPRDGDPRAAYAILDTVARTCELRRVTYDVKAAAEAILETGLDPLLAQRLFDGR